MTQSLEKEIGSLRSLFWSERDPEGRAFAPLADAYGRAGDFQQAVQLLTEGIGRHPGFSTGHVVAARLYLEKGLVAEAELAVDSALELDGDNVVALASLAEVREAQGELEEAERVRAKVRSLELATEEATEEVADSAIVPVDVFLDVTDLAPNEAAIADLFPDPVDSATEPLEIPPAELERPVEEESTGSWLDVAFPDPVAPVEDEPYLEPHAPVADLVDAVLDEPSEGELSLEPDEPVVDVLDLEPEVPVVDVLDLLAAEPVSDVLDLAPDEPVTDAEVFEAAEPVSDVLDLAPDEPVTDAEVFEADEPVVDVLALAPDEPVAEVLDVAPDEPVVNIFDLAPDEPEVDIFDLAPDEPVLDVLDLRPDGLGEEQAVRKLDSPAVEDSLPMDEMVDTEPVLTRTMAELYLEQGLTDRALRVYRGLLADNPEDDELQARIAELEGGPEVTVRVEHEGADEEAEFADPAWDAEAQAAPHDVDTPFAWTDDEGEQAFTGPAIGTFFDRLLAWQPEQNKAPDRLPQDGDGPGREEERPDS